MLKTFLVGFNWLCIVAGISHQQDINLAIIVVIIRAITDNKLYHHLKPTDSYATRFYD